MQHYTTRAVAMTPLARRILGQSAFSAEAAAASDGDMQALLADEWASLCAGLAVPPVLVDRWWGRLLQLYTEAHRAYHSVRHMYELSAAYYRVAGVYNGSFPTEQAAAAADARARLEKELAADPGPSPLPSVADAMALVVPPAASARFVSSPFAHPEAVQLAIFFHDAIYDPKATGGSNEDASARLLQEFDRDCTATAQSLWREGLQAKAAALAEAAVRAEEIHRRERAARAAQRALAAAAAAGTAAAEIPPPSEEPALSPTERALMLTKGTNDQFAALEAAEGAACPSSVVPPLTLRLALEAILATKQHLHTAATAAMRQVVHPMDAVFDVAAATRPTVRADRSHAIPFAPNHETDLGIFLDMDLAILGADRTRYERYAGEIRLEYQHYPIQAFRDGRSRILGTFAKCLAEGTLYKTPLFNAWCGAAAGRNLNWEGAALSLPDLNSRTITIGDVGGVMTFLRRQCTADQPRSVPRLLEQDIAYMAAFCFDLCLVLRVEDDAARAEYATLESASMGGAVDGRPTPVAELSRMAPPVIAACLCTLTNEERFRDPVLRGANDVGGSHVLIHYIGVHRHYRRRGVGSKLVREVIARARATSIGDEPPHRISVLVPAIPAPAAAPAPSRPRNSNAPAEEEVIMNFFTQCGFTPRDSRSPKSCSPPPQSDPLTPTSGTVAAAAVPTTAPFIELTMLL